MISLGRNAISLLALRPLANTGMAATASARMSDVLLPSGGSPLPPPPQLPFSSFFNSSFASRGAHTSFEGKPDPAAEQRRLGLRAEAGKTWKTGHVAPHPGMQQPAAPGSPPVQGSIEPPSDAHPVCAYDMTYLESIHPTHLPPKNLTDRIGLGAVQTMRWTFDKLTGYGPSMTEIQWLRRMIFLETVAGVPGMVSGMLRHLQSLRAMRKDRGWIPMLLEEAENERMHLMTFLEVRKPGPILRLLVLAAQGIFFNLYFVVYLLFPRVCHAFVGYLEEEAVRTYTHALHDIDSGKLWVKTPAPEIARTYWSLKPEATMRDVILCVRADEACHSHVNHTLKAVPQNGPNPFALGKSQLP